MTHSLSNFTVKVLADDHGERWYLFFRANVTDPFLVLPEFDIETLAEIVKFEKAQVEQGK
jgi:hypothetical protein